MHYTKMLTLSFFCIANLASYGMDIETTECAKTQPCMSIVDQETTQKAVQLLEAVYAGNLKTVKQLVADGANINLTIICQESGCKHNVLKEAYRKRYMDIVKFLIDAGSHKSQKIIDKENWWLLKASRENLLDHVQKVIANGIADINTARDGGRTAVMLAKKKEILTCLIKAGCNVNAQDKHGQTALLSSSFFGEVEKTKILIEAGADVNQGDNMGNIPLALMLDNCDSRKEKRIALLQLLCEAGVYIPKDYHTKAFKAALKSKNVPLALLSLFSPKTELYAKKKAETIFLFSTDIHSLLSMLPKEILLCVLTYAYPEYPTSIYPIANLHSEIIIEKISFKLLAELITEKILDYDNIFKAWETRIANIVQYLKSQHTYNDNKTQELEIALKKEVATRLVHKL
jgi:hypothetical protein